MPRACPGHAQQKKHHIFEEESKTNIEIENIDSRLQIYTHQMHIYLSTLED